jgi:hypothetical protein
MEDLRGTLFNKIIRENIIISRYFLELKLKHNEKKNKT